MRVIRIGVNAARLVETAEHAFAVVEVHNAVGLASTRIVRGQEDVYVSRAHSESAVREVEESDESVAGFAHGSGRERCSGKLRHVEPERPFRLGIAFGASGVESYVQSLWGISDDSSSPHYSDQAVLASERMLRPLPLSLDALEREHASKLVLTINSAKH